MSGNGNIHTGCNRQDNFSLIMRNDITWAIGGEAGFGIMSAGTMLAKTLSRDGYGVIASNEYPSLIRGGHNFVHVRITTQIVHAPKRSIELLIALNKDAVAFHQSELSEGAYVVFDPKEYAWKPEEFTRPVVLIPIPFGDLVDARGGDAVMKNTIALGATMYFFGKDIAQLEKVIADQFKGKGQAIVEENIAIARIGYDEAKSRYPEKADLHIDAGSVQDAQMVLNGSEAAGLGAVAGGMKFAAIYPMTPINALIPLFADHAKEFGIVYKQPEDEIAGMNMAIGASLAGARSLVATSGGGFALMVEGVSMAGIMEVPVVIDLGMRPGPATGMPTWTEQGELQMVLHAGHGEFPRIILAPGDANECFTLTKHAFDLADRFQTPVFLLTDKYINETQWQISQGSMQEAGNKQSQVAQADISIFKRYDVGAPEGISSRSLPGDKNREYIANSYEHDEHGYTTEDATMRKNMVNKRLRKMEAIKKSIPKPSVFGDDDADVTFVSFGSTKGVILDAIAEAKKIGIKAQLVHFSYVFPMVESQIVPILSGKKRLICIEQNATGQLRNLIREATGITIEEQWLKYGGRQWTSEDIVLKMKGQSNG